MRLTTIILSGFLAITTVTSYKLYTYASQCTARIATLEATVTTLQKEKEAMQGKYDVALARIDSVETVLKACQRKKPDTVFTSKSYGNVGTVYIGDSYK